MIYADYNGSAPLLPSVREYLKKRIDTDIYANPNAIHSIGQKVSQGIEKCREVIAEIVGCYSDQISFNSGASEGIPRMP
jgi:cysteine desulfurase